MNYLKKIRKYIKEKGKVTFRLKNHQNYFITGVFENVEERQEGIDGNLISPALISIKLDNGENYFVYEDEIDFETLCPSSYNPILFFKREPISEELRKQVFERDNFECQLKLEGCTHKAECCDHFFIPSSMGGLSTLENLKASCNHCNQKKSNKLLF